MRYVRKCQKCGGIGADEKKLHQIMPCNGKVVTLGITYTEYCIIEAISADPDFLDDMAALKEEKPTEYSEQMELYRKQIAAGTHLEARLAGMRKCPHCKSRKVVKISGTRISKLIAGGFFNQQSRANWKCQNCGHRW